MKKTGQQIAAARKLLRLRQYELAAICGIRPETISRIEDAGNVPFYLDQLIAAMERDETLVTFWLRRAEEMKAKKK